MFTNTVKLDDTMLAKIGHGLMMMTWSATPVSDETAFESIKASLDAVPAGMKMLLNTGEMYGNPPNETANLDMVARFFEKHPGYTDKAFLSVKGGVKQGTLFPDSSPENLRRSVDYCLEHLRGTKKIDLFQTGRVDPKVPVEDAMRALLTLQKEGKFDHIGMSECSEASLRRAAAVAKIAIIEIEISPIAYEKETRKVIAAAAELGILIEAYSPLAKGVLTGAFVNLDDLPEHDMRRYVNWFKPEAFEHNKGIVKAFKSIATTKNLTPAQLSLAWVSSLGPHIIPIPGSSNKSRTEENIATCDVNLTQEEIFKMNDAVVEIGLKGNRLFAGMEDKMHLWG